jgi:hypothetical protein
MARPATAIRRLQRAYDEYEMSEGFAAVVCVLTWIALYLVPAILLPRICGVHLSVIVR